MNTDNDYAIAEIKAAARNIKRLADSFKITGNTHVASVLHGEARLIERSAQQIADNVFEMETTAHYASLNASAQAVNLALNMKE